MDICDCPSDCACLHMCVHISMCMYVAIFSFHSGPEEVDERLSVLSTLGLAVTKSTANSPERQLVPAESQSQTSWLKPGWSNCCSDKYPP